MIAQFSCDVVGKSAVVLVLLDGVVSIRGSEATNNLCYVSTYRDSVRLFCEML